MHRFRSWFFRELLERINTMAESVTQGITDITALELKQAADLAKLKTDVTTALALIASAGALNATQQAAMDSLKTAMGVDDATITATDAGIAAAAAVPPSPATPVVPAV